MELIYILIPTLLLLLFFAYYLGMREEELYERSYHGDMMGGLRLPPHYYSNNTSVNPLVGAVSGGYDSEFSPFEDPAVDMMRSQLMSRSKRMATVSPSLVTSMHKKHVNQQLGSILGPNNRHDDAQKDNSPYAHLGEVAEYKLPYSVAPNDTRGLEKFEKMRAMKGPNFANKTMYEQDMADYGKEMDEHTSAAETMGSYHNSLTGSSA